MSMLILSNLCRTRARTAARYRLRQEEATTLGEISGAQSAIKNLQHQIQRLDIERQRQQELLSAPLEKKNRKRF